MDKRKLQDHLESPFDPDTWNDVLVSVFGARKLHSRPKPISLAANSISDAAFELGFLTTSDDRIIGLYTIDIIEKVRLERSKVQLRELIRSIYKYDVDGAIVVFNQGNSWRLSFISEIRVVNEDGSVETKTTEPKRFTYLLGTTTRAKTPTDRLSMLSGRKLSLDDLCTAFSVEALNKEFYQKIAEQFYELVGATTGKGKKVVSREAVLSLPGLGKDTPKNKRLRQEFAVRLIGRIIFCWFLKVKRSDQQLPLLPDSLLSSQAAKGTKNYYHGILEPLFFQVLNRPTDERISDLPDESDSIPFLNGGLFEAQTDDFYNAESVTGNFANYALKIPDDWFIELFEKLEQYNFTIDENSPTEIEVSVDPEMLGRIFENLLAEIDPDSGESARKSTGSFYTPREIVNYMVDESLILYLKGELKDGDADDDHLEQPLRKLFSYRDPENPFKAKQTRRLIDAIDGCKILDPACGSGAFPMGALQRLVHLLGKLDPENRFWKEKQLEKLDELIENAGAIDDAKVRKKVVGDLNKRRKDIDSDFARKELDYGRKLFLIENCIHGVDIQPIAAEISKLRCFLTLIVDDSVEDKEPNRGMNPLPNLEFKFVTADALLKLPASGLFNSDEQLKKLEAVRHEYINSYGATKEAARRNFQEIQDEIFDQQIKNFNDNQDRRAIALSTWKPFSHEKVDWFDPEWMFGVERFDIVIGNPPYVTRSLTHQEKRFFKTHFVTAQYQVDLYILFIERAEQILIQNGILSFITPNSWLKNLMMSVCRKFLLDNFSLYSINPNMSNVFKAASVDTSVYVAQKEKRETTIEVWQFANGRREVKNSVEQTRFYQNEKYIFDVEVTAEIRKLMDRIKENSRPLFTYVDITRGVNPYDAYTGQSQEIIKSRAYHSDYKKDKSFVPELRGKHVHRFSYNWDHKHFISYGDWLAAPREPRFFEGERLVLREILGDRFVCTLIEEDFVLDRSLYIAIPRKGENVSLKFLLALLSSKLLAWYFRYERNEFDSLFPKIRVEEFKKLPIIGNGSGQEALVTLVDYILCLKAMDESENINEYVPNSHLVEQFEEVIDALVYELYFEDEFRIADVAFHRYAARDFNSIEELDTKGKIETIGAAYQKLRAKDNEIRNNLKLMDIRLADLIGPIKNAR